MGGSQSIQRQSEHSEAIGGERAGDNEDERQITRSAQVAETNGAAGKNLWTFLRLHACMGMRWMTCTQQGSPEPRWQPWPAARGRHMPTLLLLLLPAATRTLSRPLSLAHGGAGGAVLRATRLLLLQILLAAAAATAQRLARGRAAADAGCRGPQAALASSFFSAAGPLAAAGRGGGATPTGSVPGHSMSGGRESGWRSAVKWGSPRAKAVRAAHGALHSSLTAVHDQGHDSRQPARQQSPATVGTEK